MARTLDRAPESAAGSRPLTVAEFCTELGISRSTFYDWRAKRRAPKCITLPNGSLRIRRAEYERWLASREETSW
ncbi:MULTISPECIES: helix-turn-helix domain-containing protein [unclassified Nonomuraea]|uniref:helix-turn-helix transcriptional regulator n=1 Tax=unclassified Nonomuraea TaxID=2593643 RepID=UPI0033D295FC